MGFRDALLRVSSAQAVTADAVSTDKIDLGNPTVKNRIGTGEPMGFAVVVTTALDFTTTDETYIVEVLESASADLSSPVIVASRTIGLTAAERAVGASFFIPIPPGKPALRYLGLNYNTGGTSPSGSFTADLIPQKFYGEWLAYANAYDN